MASDDEWHRNDFNAWYAELDARPPASQKVQEEEEDIQTCPICCEIIGSSYAKTKCGHIFCCECLLRASQENVNCPLCRTELVPPNPKKYTQVDLLEAEDDGVRQGFFDAQELLREEVHEREREIASLQDKLERQSWWLNDYKKNFHQEEKKVDELQKLVDHLRNQRSEWRKMNMMSIDVSQALNKQLITLVHAVSGKDCPQVIIKERISQARKMHSKFCTWKDHVKHDDWARWNQKPDPSWEEYKKSWPIGSQFLREQSDALQGSAGARRPTSHPIDDIV